MQTATTVGLDIAKSVFQVHGVDADGNVVFCRQLKRRYVLTFFQKLPPCLVGIEACASSHYWSRELQALGHTVRLMPPAHVKPYVKGQKDHASDAEAIFSLPWRSSARCFTGFDALNQHNGTLGHSNRLDLKLCSSVQRAHPTSQFRRSTLMDDSPGVLRRPPLLFNQACCRRSCARAC